MPVISVQNPFEQWWASLDTEARSGLDKALARRAFKAGAQTATRSGLPVYRFQIGKWKVAVKAPTPAVANREALRRIEDRAKKYGISPPAGSWKLMPIDTSSHSNIQQASE
jgi:hypothetical protein